MLGLFSKEKKCKHDWKNVAYDCGFNTTYTDTQRTEYHDVYWTKCKLCGERGFDRPRDSLNHKSLTKAKMRWIELDMITGTKEIEVYDENYQLYNQSSNIYKFQPMTGTQRILKYLKNDSEFKDLCNNHKMIKDAFGELETAVKLHENIDNGK